MEEVTEGKKHILKGVFQKLNQWTRNRPYYTETEYMTHLKELEIKMRKEQRKKLRKKIMKVKNVNTEIH